MVQIPDAVSMDELSKWWIQKALQNIETENTQKQQLENSPPQSSEDEN